MMVDNKTIEGLTDYNFRNYKRLPHIQEYLFSSMVGGSGCIIQNQCGIDVNIF
jgi:hypothetical protein